MSGGYPNAPAKPSKPYPDRPLVPHATGRWTKTIQGRRHHRCDTGMKLVVNVQ
jgi:hypothetical protein